MNGVVIECQCGWIGLATTRREVVVLQLDHAYESKSSGHMPAKEIHLSGLRIEDFANFRQYIHEKE